MTLSRSANRYGFALSVLVTLVVALGSPSLGAEETEAAIDQGPWRALLSPPEHQTITETKVMVPMSDGVRLAADIVRPRTPGSYPVILMRTPYGRQGLLTLEGPKYAPRGYVVVSQDVRGCFDSEGEWFPIENEVDDGYDTLQWLTEQPWCDGQVGMVGGSYVGWVQWLAAKSGHPALKAIVPQVSPPDPMENIPYEGGTFAIGAVWWAGTVQKIHDGSLTSLADGLGNGSLDTLPLADLDDSFDIHHDMLDVWLSHPPTDEDYWDTVSYQPYFEDFDLPALNISGWFDGDQPGAVQNYAGMRRDAATEAARRSQYLIMGAWPHAFNTPFPVAGDFGPSAIIDLDAVILRFFDRYLKGIDNGFDDEDPVWVFAMGRNRWHQERDWPLPQTVSTPVYLKSGGRAQKIDGDGFLSLDPKPQEEGADYDEFVYDPAAYNADVGYGSYFNAAPLGDQSKAVDRADELDFLSEPLSHAIEITGNVEARLFVSSDAEDTDFVVAIYQVQPDGKTFLVASGIQRVRYRDGVDDPVPPGEVAEVLVDCWATSVVLAAGTRLHVKVSSCAFPGYARHLNTLDPIDSATEIRVARNRVWHDGERASAILLPVIPREDSGLVEF